MKKAKLTRRQFVLACAVSGCALATSGCGNLVQKNASSSTSQTQGFGPETEIKSYPVSLKLYADANIALHSGGSAAAKQLGASGLDKLHEYIVRYQSQTDRGNVTIDVEYVSFSELAKMASAGFSSGDGIIADASTVEAGTSAGTIAGGNAGYLTSDVSYNFPETCMIVRAQGSSASLPAARTLNGTDSPDGTINQLQQLPSFDGTLAVVSPNAATEGICANRILAREGFYTQSGGTSGEFSENVASKIRTFQTQDEAVGAVVAGQCQLGFAFQSTIGSKYSGIEACYKPAGNSLQYSASALECCKEKGVMRDFFAFITSCTD